MTKIKLGKLGSIGNWDFGLMLLQIWFGMAAVCLFILPSNVAGHILCSVGVHMR